MTWIVGLAFVLALYYPLAMMFRSDWSANSAGKSQLLFAIVVAAVLFLVLLRQLGVILPDSTRGPVYGLIALGLLVQDITLTNIQNRRRARLAREREEINR